MIIIIIVILVSLLLFIVILSNHSPTYNVSTNLPLQLDNFTLKNATDITSQASWLNTVGLIASYKADYINNISDSSIQTEKFLFKNNTDVLVESHYILNNSNKILNELFNSQYNQVNLPDNVTELYYETTYGALINVVSNGQLTQLSASRVINGTVVTVAEPSTPVYFFTLEKPSGKYLLYTFYLAIGNNLNLNAANSTAQAFLNVSLNDINIIQNTNN